MSLTSALKNEFNNSIASHQEYPFMLSSHIFVFYKHLKNFLKRFLLNCIKQFERRSIRQFSVDKIFGRVRLYFLVKTLLPATKAFRRLVAVEIISEETGGVILRSI